MPLTPDAIFSEATVPPPDPAWMQPTIRGPMPVPPQALPVPTATYLAPQASVWPGVPGVWGQAAQLPPGGLPPTGAQLPPGGLPPTLGLHLPLLQLLPGGLHPAMAPPTAPAHCWGHPLLAGTLLPQQPMGLWPGAVFHGEPPQPAGTCLPQAPGRPGPPPVLLQVPPLQEQVLPVPCTLPATWESPMEPFQDAVVLTQDQGHPAPTDGCPHPATAPLGCSTAALDSGGEFGGCGACGRLSAPGGCGKAGIAPLGMSLLFQQPQRAQTSRRTWRTSSISWHGSTTVSLGAAELAGGCWHPPTHTGCGKESWHCPTGHFLPFPEVTSKTGILYDDADIDDLLTWINNGESLSEGQQSCWGGVCTEGAWESRHCHCPAGHFLPFPEETPSTRRLDNNDVEMDRLLTWIDGETVLRRGDPQRWLPAPSGCGKAAIIVRGDVLAFSEAALESALEVPQHKQDLPGVTREGTKATANSCQTQELMQRITATEPLSPDVSSSLDSSSSSTEHSDSSGASRELSKETHPESGLLSNSLCWQPASPELPVPTPLAAPAPPSPRTAHLMEEARRRQPRVVLTRLALPTPLAAPAPLLPRAARLIQEVQRRQPRVVLTRLALPPGCISCRLADMHHKDSTEPAKCPAPACTTTNSKSTGHEQHTGSGPATKRKLPRCHDGPGHKHRR